MADIFSPDTYHHHLLQADALGAADYLRRFPEKQQLAQQYHERFELRRFDAPTGHDLISAVLHAYADYYCDACWKHMKRAAAEINLHDQLRSLFPKTGRMSLQDMEDTVIREAFAAAGYHFLGGCTEGLRGPYVWRDTETCTYDAALPDGTQPYTVKLLDGFIHKSWLDYLSFGALGTGGWTDDDGVICCIRSGYDFDSEKFRVSLLKHEAQHAADLQRYTGLRRHELEYRAKLVELIFSQERDMLTQFMHEADPEHEGISHSYASEMIMRGLCSRFSCDRIALPDIPRSDVQEAARILLDASTDSLSDRLKHP